MASLALLPVSPSLWISFVLCVTREDKREFEKTRERKTGNFVSIADSVILISFSVSLLSSAFPFCLTCGHL